MIGSGFIGCEISASLRMRGHHVELVSDEIAPNIARLGDEAAAVLTRWLEEQGVSLHLGTAVERIQRGADGFEVIADGDNVSGEVVIMATGVAPAWRACRGCGGHRARRGRDPGQRRHATARADVLAAGDVCRAREPRGGPPPARRALGRRARSGRDRGCDCRGQASGVEPGARGSGRRSARAR